MILLSFDIEEFDMPLEYGKEISFENQIAISEKGTELILNLLQKHQIKATFFSTVVFAEKVPHLIKRIINEGHELASHTYYHSDFEVAHLKQSKEALEALSNSEVIGFRMPRMYPVDEQEIENAGYLYNSSINPTFLPGRYNHFDKPRTYFKVHNVWQIPASVSPIIRFPLFWLSFHNLPLKIYKFLAKWTYKNDGYLNIYFHPWEFADLSKYSLPFHVKRGHQGSLLKKIECYLKGMQKNDLADFITMNAYIKNLSDGK